jgi:hypothetical protein
VTVPLSVPPDVLQERVGGFTSRSLWLITVYGVGRLTHEPLTAIVVMSVPQFESL